MRHTPKISRKSAFLIVEANYQQEAERYNAQAEKIQAGNVAIAASAERIATETTKAERLRNDAAYQLRRAVEAGGRILPSRLQTAPGATAPALSTTQVQLIAPTKPDETSAQFLARWDAVIRLTNFAELLLTVVTLIYVRTRSAKSNSPTTQAPGTDFYSPHSVASRSPVPRPAFSTTQSDTVSRENRERKETTQDDTAALKEGLKVLRETLRDIAFYTPSGIQRTGHGEKASLAILRSALKTDTERFRGEVEEWLREHGFTV